VWSAQPQHRTLFTACTVYWVLSLSSWELDNMRVTVSRLGWEVEATHPAELNTRMQRGGEGRGGRDADRWQPVLHSSHYHTVTAAVLRYSSNKMVGVLEWWPRYSCSAALRHGVTTALVFAGDKCCELSDAASYRGQFTHSKMHPCLGEGESGDLMRQNAR